MTSAVNMAAIRHGSSFSGAISNDYLERRQDYVVRTALMQRLYCLASKFPGKFASELLS
jgi:hypothetical protein